MLAHTSNALHAPQTQNNLFQEWLATQSVDLSLSSFLINLGLAVLLATVLGKVYVRYGRSLSNRELFAKNFWPLAVGTMLIITIVKSSLALSLGLVGALSIVRFRAAIKEPEELIFLFFAIAIGLGLGADQYEVTIAAIVVVAVLFVLGNFRRTRDHNKNLLISVTTSSPDLLPLNLMSAALQEHCSVINMKRFDETDEALEASFLVEVEGFERLSAAREALRQLDASAKVTFLDNKGIF